MVASTSLSNSQPNQIETHLSIFQDGISDVRKSYNYQALINKLPVRYYVNRFDLDVRKVCRNSFSFLANRAISSSICISLVDEFPYLATSTTQMDELPFLVLKKIFHFP